MTRPPDAPPASADWAQQPERSNLAILRLMVWISLRLGRRVGRVVRCHEADVCAARDEAIRQVAMTERGDDRLAPR